VELSRQDYIEIILDHHDNPRNRRQIESAQIHGSGGNPGCGDIVVVYAHVGPAGLIDDASFEGEGCTISQAGASMLTEELIGKRPEEVIEMSFEDVIIQMGRDVVSSRTRCATLALSTAKRATEDYLKDRRSAESAAIADESS
jgi:nitrogen fixation NifU-like protein